MPRSQAVRESLSLRIEPSPYTTTQVLLTAHTPSSAMNPVNDNNNDDQESILFSVLCMYDFDAEEDGLLSFRKNEILDIIKQDNTGWWAAMRHNGSTPVVGWIPQAYVNALSEEMADRLRSVREEVRVAEYDAENLYNNAPVVDNVLLYDPDSATPSPSTDYSGSNPRQQSSTAASYYSNLEAQSSSRKPMNMKSSQSSPRRINPPPSPTSPMPLPPSRSGSFSRSAKSSPAPDDSRNRSTSLSSSRSIRRRPVMVNDNPTLSRLSTLIQSNNTREIAKLSSPDIAGSFEALAKRGDGTVSRKKTMDNLQQGHSNPKPWYLVAQRLHVDEDEKGRIRAGSLPALVERLTSEPPLDPAKLTESRTFTNIFLLTFRTFTTGSELFDLLVARYNLKPPKSLTDVERKDWKLNLRLPIRRRIMEVFSLWLEEYQMLEEEPHVARRLQDFLNNVNELTLKPTAENINQNVERLTFTIPSKLLTTTSPKKSRKSKAHKNDLLKLDPADIAEQLTLYEFSLYVKITPQECIAYTKTQTGESVAKLLDFCATYDKLGSWVKTTVLNNEVLSKRADIVDFWIKVAEKCRLLSNFASMSSIVVALSSVVLTRLHMTWAQVRHKSNLDSLLRHNEPTGGFAGYRSLMQQVDGPCVPFISMFLTDLVHAQEHYGKQLGGQICFYQRARWYEIITSILHFQLRPYRIAPNDATTMFIEAHLREAGSKDPNWFWNKSQEVQHSEVAHADIRKGLEAAGF